MAKGAREFNDRGFEGGRDFEGGRFGEGFEGGRFGDFDRFRGLGRGFDPGDRIEIRCRTDPFFAAIHRRECLELALIPGLGFNPFNNPFGGGIGGFPGPFFGGFPEFDEFGRFGREGFGDFDRFGRGGFEGGRGDFGGMREGIHPGGGEGGGHRAFATTVRGRDMQGDRRGQGQSRGTFGGEGDQGGRRGGQSRRENQGRRGFGGEGGRRGFEGGRGRFGDFDGRFRGGEFRDFDRFRGGGFDRDDFFGRGRRGRFGEGFEGGRGTQELLEMCLQNPFFAQQPICQELLAGQGGIGGFPGFLGGGRGERGEGRFGERGEGFRGGEGGERRGFLAQAGGALPGHITTGGPMMMKMPMMAPAHQTAAPAMMPGPMMGGTGGRMAGARPMASPIGSGSLHPAGDIGHGMGGVPQRGMTGGIEGRGLHPGDMPGRGGDMGGMRGDRGGEGRGFRDLGDRGDGRHEFDFDGRRGFIDFDGRFRFDDDDFVQPITFGVDNEFLLEERCLTDVIFAETHPELCLPLLERGGFRSILGQPVVAFATNAGAGGAHVGGGMMGGGMMGGGFHPADPGQGGIGHATEGGFRGMGGDFRGDERGGIGHPDFDFVRFHPERFSVFGERIFDYDLGDFLPFGIYEYQLALAQNPYFICSYFPELCLQRRPPFLAYQPLLGRREDFDVDQRRLRRPAMVQRSPMMIPGQAMLPQVAPMVAVSSTSPSPAFMNATATTSTGAVLPVIPAAPDLSAQMPAQLMQTAQVATAGTESFADTDPYANIPNSRRGSILGQPGNPMAGRTNISMSNYF